MPRGIKTDNKKVQEIIASYALTNSYNKTAKDVKVSPNTVKNVIKKQKETNSEEFAKVCEEKKELFQDKANKIINKSLMLLDKRFNKALEDEDTIDEIIQMIYSYDKEEMNEVEKKSIVSKLRKVQLNSLSEITTSMGTLYDKMRLAKGESTGNIQVSYEDALKQVCDKDEY